MSKDDEVLGVDWEEVNEEGNTFYVHPEHGNVFKQSDTSYVALFPKVCKMGPFKSLEEAKKVLETCKEKVDQAIELVNEELVNGK